MFGPSDHIIWAKWKIGQFFMVTPLSQSWKYLSLNSLTTKQVFSLINAWDIHRLYKNKIRGCVMNFLLMECRVQHGCFCRIFHIWALFQRDHWISKNPLFLWAMIYWQFISMCISRWVLWINWLVMMSLVWMSTLH